MESSEDDAGAATNASRRASARERDVGGGEDGGASDDMPQEPTEAATASESASLSEEAYDADSVPSPSSHDVNTSTEAILDMIDEIVDGPDASRRRSHTSPEAGTDGACTAPTEPSVATELQAPCDPDSPKTPSSPTILPVNTDIDDVSQPQESESDFPSESEPQCVAETCDTYVQNVSPSVNNTVEECLSAAPTGVSSPAEVLQEKLEYSTQDETVNSRCVSVEVDNRPANQENIESEYPPCVLLPDESALSVPITPTSEPCPEESLAGGSTESVPQASECEDPAKSPNVVQSENINIILTSSDIPIEVLPQSLPEPIESPQASSSVASNEAAESTSGEAAVLVQSDESSNLSPSLLPSSSIAEIVPIVTDSSENQVCERTIKCVTSSENRDDVTVESAESTCSESSSSGIGEDRGSSASIEPATRSPLRRRLVRPTPSDRRPDSTVSSSVDLQTVHVDTTEQTTSESVTKDVSSSSDAVTSVYCNIKPEEIRVSEISVCKAETSMSPPKKIKLVRQKITPFVALRDNISELPVSRESEQCQSTSSENTPPAPQDFASSSSSFSQTTQPEESIQSLNVCATSAPVVHLPEKSVEGSCKIKQDSDGKLQDSDSIHQSATRTERQETSKDEEEKRVPPIKLNLSTSTETASTDCKLENQELNRVGASTEVQDTPGCAKQVPKLTIKLSNKQSEEAKSPIPKLTIKPIKPPLENDESKKDVSDKVPSIMKLNIKPIPKPSGQVNDIHRKSSSSEISESESSENDESNSMSDPASNSDQGSEVIPKVTIKVGKPGTESEGKFYTEQNAPKLLIKGLQSNEIEEHVSTSKSKLVISQQQEEQEKQPEKIPKLTIKTVSKSEGQSLSPKLTIKSIKLPESLRSESSVESSENPPIPKMRITSESISSNRDVKENAHVPKITIKNVMKSDSESASRTPKKSSVVCDSPEHIPVVTKLNIKPILKPIEFEKTDNLDEKVPVISKLNIKPIFKPAETGETSESQIPVVSKLNIKPIIKPANTNETTESSEDIPTVSKLNIKPILKPSDSGSSSEGIGDKVPVVSKLNIKPILKPKDNEIESSLEDIPKVTKLNIKPLKNPEEKSSGEKDCDVKNADTEENSIPVVTKINIKPIIMPVDEDTSKDSENQSSETGNSSDDNTDHIPVVTKINIKPIVKPNEQEQESSLSNVLKEESVPVITKLNIKPLVKPDECKSPSSPKRDMKITKLNIKPVMKPEEVDEQRTKNESDDVSGKNPPLLMKINIKNVTDTNNSESRSPDNKKTNSVDDSKQMANNLEENIPKVTKINIKPIVNPENTATALTNCKQSSSQSHQNEIAKQNCVPNLQEDAKYNKHVEKSKYIKEETNAPEEVQKQVHANPAKATKTVLSGELGKSNVEDSSTKSIFHQAPSKPKSSLQNCTLLKKLLETKKDGLDKRLDENKISVNHIQPLKSEITLTEEHFSTAQHCTAKVNSEIHRSDVRQNRIIDAAVYEVDTSKQSSVGSVYKDSNESLAKPLEISISDKLTNQSSGQDSPRIILKINKTDHGPSAKLITEDRPSTPQQNAETENTQETVSEKQTQKRVINSRKKALPDTPVVQMGKRLRSSRIVEEKSPIVKKNVGKRPPSTETSPVQNKEPEISVLESKRLKLGQLLSNKSLTITPVPAKSDSVPPTKPSTDSKETLGKTVNHSLLNNENCSKNGNSKLHNILSNLQAKQAQAIAFNEITRAEKISITPELDSNTSTGSSDVIEVIVPVENSHSDVMIINDNTESRELVGPPEEVSQDPLEVAPVKPSEEAIPSEVAVPSPVPLTPQPKKRGRPRKLPLSEPAKSAAVVLPVPALEERPQRSLRLSRERPTPTILVKRRGRGRGRGARRLEPEPREEPVVETANKFFVDEKPAEDIDPTSSRIKLPRMTEALDKLPTCTTPLSSRRRSSSTAEMKLFDSEPKVVLNILPKLEEALGSPPETPVGRGGRGRGRRGARGQGGRTPRSGRGRGRGGGRGAQYMKETMGIYGRVCGPATTTVQLFEEETCMMDDNATPDKSMNYDEDSQSSVLSSTNDSSRMKKSKFADLFDSNKIWTAADVKEYVWPPPATPDVEHQVMMIQEQVAMFLGVKSFKRRYPELKRRAVTAAERDHVLHKGLVTEALCDLGITAVDASEVLDIMLSDFPHKYEEYRQHQRERQIAEATAAAEEPPPEKPEQKPDKIEIKVEAKPVEVKPEPPKVDLEKTRQEALAAAIASASEWNLRLNARRARACVDLQSGTVQRRRAPTRPASAPRTPPAGLYPHALLPGQYTHHYTTYTSEQLRYFPLSTVLAAPPPPPDPPSSSESEPDCSSSGSDRSDTNRPSQRKRKKLTKTKRSSQVEVTIKEEVKEEVVDLCRVCKLRLEANRKYTHERFLVCATCNAKLHPGCVDLSADTIRCAREYAWQCGSCKACSACRDKQDAGNMLHCDLCDRAFHERCVRLPQAPQGRWHCEECAICKSCGARSPAGAGAGAGVAGGEEATWHHQTRRGPGGHKVYSHSLCTPCARAYRIGRYCPLCDRSFIGPKGTMQLVICKLCDRQHHQDCVRQTVPALNVLDYTCGECRRGGITSRSAAARLAPRTIATLFMAKRRFNKYAHKQYLQSRAAELRKDDEESREPEPSDVSDSERLPGEPGEPSDPLEGAGESLDAGRAPEPDAESRDETAAAVAALQMDFGD